MCAISLHTYKTINIRISYRTVYTQNSLLKCHTSIQPFILYVHIIHNQPFIVDHILSFKTPCMVNIVKAVMLYIF